MTHVARAPGKAIVCGEYAVLDGAPAISVAVDRRVVARVGDGPSSPFVAAALAHAARAFGDPRLASLAVTVDSAALYEGEAKLGLGSSAAVTAAVVGLAAAHAGVALDDRARLFAVADAAHAEAQGVAGSGIDVATSIHGGAVHFTRAGGVANVRDVAWPRDLQLTFVFAGESASTPKLVGMVQALRARAPSLYRARVDALGEIARAFAAAIDRGDAAAAVAAARGWTPALAALGTAADAPIVTPFFERLAQLAAAHGGSAKPSGAGGGDLGVALTVGDVATATLRDALARQGLRPLALSGPVPGLSLETTP